MYHIPGLDIAEPSDATRRFSIFGAFHPILNEIGNIRSEEDFNCTSAHKLKAQITLAKGHDVENSKDVSIVVYDEGQDPDNELTDILQEIENISDLDHDNVLKFYEVVSGTKLTDVAFVFEPHVSLLSEIIEANVEKLYEPPVIKTVIKDIYSALNYLHQNRIIHRNIQPENIVITSNGVLKVWNFRNAMRFGQKPKKFRVHEFRYQSLELLLECEKYNEAVDVWSANCIFVQLWLKEKFCCDHGREKVLEYIIKLLGFPAEEIWKEFLSFTKMNNFSVLSKYRYSELDNFFQEHCESNISLSAMDLIHKCFRYNPKHRMNAEQCLLHFYFFEEPTGCHAEDIVKVLENALISNELRKLKERKKI